MELNYSRALTKSEIQHLRTYVSSICTTKVQPSGINGMNYMPALYLLFFNAGSYYHVHNTKVMCQI